MNSIKQVAVSGGFDNVRAGDLRFLQEAAKLGELTVFLWPDKAIEKLTGMTPKFPFAERLYFLNAVRYVNRVIELGPGQPIDRLPDDFCAEVWADVEAAAN